MLINILLFINILILSVAWILIRKKRMYIWLGGYIIQNIFRKDKLNQIKPVHIMFCFVDHFEPQWKKPLYEVEAARVNAWIEKYPKIAEKFKDADGKFPQHTFFYPAEEYRAEHLEKLSQLCKKGFGEIEIHLHHENDTSKGFKEKLLLYKSQLIQHNLLSYDNKGNLRYGFIHGNWALDNSRDDGRFCGVNNEIEILRDTGCYADFTLPSAPHKSQTRKINSIYYAKDDPKKPKSHNIGIDVEVGKEPSGDLIIIQGPLTLNWRKRKWRVLPHIENGEISYKNPPTKERVDLWIKERIHAKGRPDWIFIKIHTHGAQEKNWDVLLGQPMQETFSYLENNYNDGKNYILHYVTAREMHNLIKAAEGGKEGAPSLYRDYLLKKINER